MTFDVEIVPIPGTRMANLIHDGRILRRCGNNGYAEYYARIEEARLRKANGRERPCISCGDSIISEGPHHRQCTTCRSRS